MHYYNVHTHTFTMNNAPKNFLQLYLPKPLANLIDTVTDVQLGSYILQNILKHGGNGTKRYSSFLRIGKSKNQPTVFKELREQYSDDNTFRFVALTMDMEKCGAGESDSGYEGQLEEILAVKKIFPDNLFLFLGVDPRWKLNGADLMKTVKSYFDNKLMVDQEKMVNPFIGIKIYPSMGYYPFDERLMETMTWAAENNIPVLSHCNYLGGLYHNVATYIDGVINGRDPYNNDAPYPQGGIQYKEQKNIGRWLLGRQAATNNLNRCSYFMEPCAFESMLKYFKERGTPLKLCLAHFGGGNQITDNKTGRGATPFGAAKKNWFVQIKDMMSRYDSLYSDISYALHDTTIHHELISEILNPEYGNRVMFGTDFFLTEREGPELNTYRIFKQHALDASLQSGINIWDRVASLNTEKFLRSKFFNG